MDKCPLLFKEELGSCIFPCSLLSHFVSFCHPLFCKMMTKDIFQAFSFDTLPPAPPHLLISHIFHPFIRSHFQTLSIHGVSIWATLPRLSLALFLHLSGCSAGGLTNYSPLILFLSFLFWHSPEDTWLNSAGQLCVHLFSLPRHPSLHLAPPAAYVVWLRHWSWNILALSHFVLCHTLFCFSVMSFYTCQKTMMECVQQCFFA